MHMAQGLEAMKRAIRERSNGSRPNNLLEADCYPPRSSRRALERAWIFSGAKRDVGALAAQFQALEKVAHALAEAVVAEGAALDLVNEPSPEHRRLIS